MSMIKNQIAELELLSVALGDNSYHWHTVTAKELHNWEEVVDSAIATIKELSAKVAPDSMERSDRYYNGGWIPCEKAMPNICEDVLVCTDMGEIYIGFITHETIWATNTLDHSIDDDTIIAWQPLPKAYKEVDE